MHCLSKVCAGRKSVVCWKEECCVLEGKVLCGVVQIQEHTRIIINTPFYRLLKVYKLARNSSVHFYYEKDRNCKSIKVCCSEA